MTQASNSNDVNASSSRPSKRQSIKESKSVDQILSAGREAAVILRNDVFNDAYQSLFQSYQDQIIDSQPHEMNKREYLYNKCQVLSDVVSELGGMYNQAVSLTGDPEGEEFDPDGDGYMEE
jgi:hypothetical protein